MNKGTEYELFVKDVYEILNRADGLDDVQIQHDVKLTGVTGVERQIDVFWTFRRGGVLYRVAVECKDYKSRVNINRMAAFHDLLVDLGNINGIFATKNGFQSGAIEYAKKHNIQIMEIRHPNDKDWEGLIRDIHIEVHFHGTQNEQPTIYVDKKKAEGAGLGLPESPKFNSRSDQTIIEYDAMIEGEKVSEKETITMYDLIKRLPSETAGKDLKYRFDFRNGFLSWNDMRLPIEAIVFTYDAYDSMEPIDIYGDQLIKAIVKNITEGTETHIDMFGRVKVIEEGIIFDPFP